MIRFTHKRCLLLLVTLLLIVGGTVLLKQQNALLRACFPSKVYVHRVNSLQKQQDALASKYRGLELDVIFGDGQFDVNHGPEPSIGLYLTEYLSQLEDRSISIWLDYKNLDANKSQSSAMHLDQLCEQLNIKRNKILVESQAPEYLSAFAKKGFRTSYYLPVGLSRMNKVEQEQTLATISNHLHAHPTNYISFGREDYTLVKNNYPEVKKLTWGFYTWGFSGDQALGLKQLAYSAITLPMKIRILLDKQVEVLLVSYNSEGGNR